MYVFFTYILISKKHMNAVEIKPMQENPGVKYAREQLQMKILPANIPNENNAANTIGAVQPGSAGRLTGFNKGWYNHGNLPHFDQGGIFQAITYRLSDSLPQEYLKSLQAELENHDSESMEADRRKEIEELLDRGHGSCVLKNKEYAEIVEKNWQHFNGVRYKLIAYVIMPNHVHIMINAYPGFELGKIIASWKGYSARRINKLNAGNAGFNNKSQIAGQTASASGVWQRGYWDRYIRDEKHFYQAIEYIKRNFNSGGVLLG